jgi:hypothetical protein
MNAPVTLTVLSDMAGQEIHAQLEQAAQWKLKTLDLKTIFNKNIADLTEAEASELAIAMKATAIGVQAFSTHLFKIKIEDGEAAFAAQLDLLDRVLILARRLQPKMIRLIAAETNRRAEITDSSSYILHEHPWLMSFYAEAVNRIHLAGFTTVIENETGQSIFNTPHEICGFFTALGLRNKVSFTWDVQNLWQLGTFPTLAVYQQLRPFIGYLHLKGGRSGPDGQTLKYRSSLESASWPVIEITRAVIADGISPVICLNPSHGAENPDFPMHDVFSRDLAFLRRQLAPDLI